MGYPTRIYYTEADKALMWDRWQKGESPYWLLDSHRLGEVTRLVDIGAL